MAASSGRSDSAVYSEGEEDEGTGLGRGDYDVNWIERRVRWLSAYIALHPLLVEATRQPSVVAIGM